MNLKILLFVVSAALTTELHGDSPSDLFIREYGINGEACFAPETAGLPVQCVSGDRRHPVAIGETLPDTTYLCHRTSTGGLTGCQPDDPAPYVCAFGVCGCYGYNDCLDLSVEQQCKVHVGVCEGCSEIYGVCVPGTLDI